MAISRFENGQLRLVSGDIEERHASSPYSSSLRNIKNSFVVE